MFLFLYFCMFVSKVTLEVVDELNFFSWMGCIATNHSIFVLMRITFLN